MNTTRNEAIRSWLQGQLQDGRREWAWFPEGLRGQMAAWASTNGQSEPTMPDEYQRWTVSEAAGTWLVAITNRGGAYVRYEPRAQAQEVRYVR